MEVVDSFDIEDGLNLTRSAILKEAMAAAKERGSDPAWGANGLFIAKAVGITQIDIGKRTEIAENGKINFVDDPNTTTYTILVYGTYNEISD